MSHVYLVAAEDSGDAIGADVIDAMRAKDPAVRISGIGGERMRAKGVSADIDMSGLAVLGLIEGLKAYGRVKQAVEDTADAIAKVDPDSVVLIDSWGFMWRVARALKMRGVRAKRIKLIGPQVWATRPGRARVLAQWVDHLLCIHQFE
ncbi:MAG: lipid-A-disaccharide synthase, partial [Hyphomonadaceae bacterium]